MGMLQEIVFNRDEILIGIFIITVLIVYLLNRKQLSNFPYRIYFEISLFSFICSKILTIAENFFWGEFLNVLEHLFLLNFSMFLIIWIIKMNFTKTEVEEK